MKERFTVKLIRAIQDRPVLYLQSHPEHKNVKKRLEAWREIREELDEDVPVLKIKWKNLKDSYKKYKLCKQGDHSKAVRKLHSWAWARYMTFLDSPDEPELAPPEGTSNALPPLKYREETRQETARREDSNVTDTNAEKYRRKRHLERINLQSKKIRLSDEKVDVKCDGVDLLFLGYSNTFKKLSKQKQISVKFDLAKIFMEAEMSDLNDLQNPPDLNEEYLESGSEYDDPLNSNDTIKEETMQVSVLQYE